MFPILAPMAIGAIGGALMSKKKPLNGALLGAGLGAGAGTAFPAMGGILGGAGAASVPTTAAAAAAAPTATAVPAAVVPETGLLASTNAALTEYKPMMDAAAIGLQASGAMDQQAPQMQAPQVQQMQGGNQTLAAIAGQGGGAAQMQNDMQERIRRRQMMRGGV